MTQTPAPSEQTVGPPTAVDRVWYWLVAAPAAAGIVAALLFVAAEGVGLHPFADPPLTLSEAAAVGEAPVLVRLLRGGASPLARYPVRRDIIGGAAPQLLTPLDAAVLRDQVGTVRLLEVRMLIDQAARVRLVCLARQAGARDTAAWLMREGLDVSPEACRQAGAPDQQ